MRLLDSGNAGPSIASSARVVCSSRTEGNPSQVVVTAFHILNVWSGPTINLNLYVNLERYVIEDSRVGLKFNL